MKITKWGDCQIKLKPSDPQTKMLFKKTGFIEGFNEGSGIDAYINLPKLDIAKTQARYRGTLKCTQS